MLARFETGPIDWLFSFVAMSVIIGAKENSMITGGNATVFVSNMDNAVRFYTDTLGLRLTNRFGDHWATVDAGHGLTIGLHPASPKYPAPGSKGGMMVGLEIGIPIDDAVSVLRQRGVKIGGIVRDLAGNFADLQDPDGNPIYLWEVNRAEVPEPEMEHCGSTVQE
jgi:catechol 2,3-dioxygenase-like lactoylglutathione lyase family enzyme